MNDCVFTCGNCGCVVQIDRGCWIRHKDAASAKMLCRNCVKMIERCLTIASIDYTPVLGTKGVKGIIIEGIKCKSGSNIIDDFAELLKEMWV